MPRVKRGVIANKRKKKIFKLAKGYRGARSKLLKTAKEAIAHALQYAYRDRRNKKRDFRRLWVVRINAAARSNGLSYSRMVSGLKLAGIDINRKILAELAVNDAAAFSRLAEVAKEALSA
ncbi:MAG: 50S ribosomal protein L20 [bacterium]|jgi:large subunit ribosomal protein L20|nr:50S ribosomal protein L20 [bacterium]MDD3805504.1 50S ribosomal protein L20 [bacterium]MDD4153728.1 50S ribosomal protein L20 [bacterium]MDD4557393.1 50S ribosomal protein L20 [bacterium]